MDVIQAWMGQINGFLWGPVMLALILGTGLFLQLRLGFMPVRRIGPGFRLMWRGRTGDAGAAGEVSPFAALMTCLSATVGVGMATKYAEIVLAVHFRERDEAGHSVGGPMYAIKNGLGKRWASLGTAFALFGGLAGFGIGNMEIRE